MLGGFNIAGGRKMAFRVQHQASDAATGFTSFHIHDTANGRNTAIYLLVPTPAGRRLGRLQLAKATKQAAKQALLDAAAAL